MSPTTAATPAGITVRAMQADDAPAVQGLLRAALGGQRNPENLEWKHRQNPFGASPSWVAEAAGGLAAFRTFLRWEFTADGSVVRAVRAVDTATHPDHQGRGLFTALTLHGLEELRAEGVAFVFNTPNGRSRPGYLKMGWTVVGRLPVGFLPRSPATLPRILTARTAADLSSEPVEAGLPANAVLSDGAGLERLLAALPPQDGLATHRTTAYLRWRYGFGPLAYRALLVRSSPEEGLLLFRVRRRGRARELVVAELLLPRPSFREAHRLVRRALAMTRADYALGLRMQPGTGLLPLPLAGPLLTCRSLADPRPRPMSRWKLSLGDIELF